MSNYWVIYALVFGAALFGVQSVHRLFFRARQQKKVINRRLALGNELSNPSAVLEALRRERGFADFDNPTLTRVNDFIVQTGLNIERNTLSAYVFAFAAGLFILFSFVFGLGVFALLLAVAVAVVGTFLYLKMVRSRRIARFAEQLPDALDVIVRGVRVGHPFSTALGLVAKEMPDPMGTEFGMTSDEISFGSDLNTAIENLSRRVGQEDLDFFVVAINVQSQTGGNLAEILDRLSSIIRQRSRVRLKIKSLTAEGRLSSIFLTLVPFIIFGLINVVAPSFYGDVRNHPAAIPVLIIALTLLAIGNVVIRRMVNFKT